MKTWNQISKKLEKKLSQDEFNTWIRPLQGEFKENSLEISAPNDFVLNYVSNNLKSHIYEVVASKDTKIIFKDKNNSTFVDKYVEKPSSRRKNNPGLVDSFVFDAFVEGKSNHLALAASKQVAQNPTGDYNPLFIYGGVGLGKTHLMHAVGNEILNQDPSKRVIYVHSEKFVADMVKALQLNAINEFKNFYRTADALLIDDIQFFAGKEQSQDELFHTFNSLIESGNMMIFSCDRYPKEIEGLEVFKNVTDLKEIPSIINFVVPPNESRTVTNYLVSKGYDNFWYQPGAESQKISTYLNENNKNFVDDKCIMVVTRLSEHYLSLIHI